MKLILIFILSFCSLQALANGKILATPGVSQIEGSAGGGLVPWAQLAGYASEDEIAISGFCSFVNVDDFALQSCGVQGNFYDRVELSFAEQTFDVDPLSLELQQKIYGAKVRLYGDLIYSKWPQVSFGVQHKVLETETVPFALGAKEKSGTDVYVAASKLHLGAVAGYNWLWNISLRRTSANQIGLLGFGGDADRTAHKESWHVEASTAVLVNKSIAIGIEYRAKPDNLGLGEQDWKDIFIAWFPNKHISLTAAYVDLGSIAGFENQKGLYFSLMGYY